MLASFPSTFQLDESRFASYYTWYIYYYLVLSPYLFQLIFLYSRWMGEKYDGVRCCWHPLDQQLYLVNLVVDLFYDTQ